MIRVDGVDYAKVERDFHRWWDIHGVDRPLHVRIPVGAAGVWPQQTKGANGRLVAEAVGGFCHCEFESEGVEMWGFQRPADRARFVNLYGGEIL